MRSSIQQDHDPARCVMCHPVRSVLLGSLLFAFLLPLYAMAFPSWIGVYGEYVMHNGANPGVYTILMNEDYGSLQAEVGVAIGSNWATHAMTYVGHVDGNSVWQYIAGEAYPVDAEITYYFHGWDDADNHIYASNGGANYSFVAGPSEIVWIGDTEHSPSAPVAGEDIEVETQTWPKGAGQSGFILYGVDSVWAGTGLARVLSTNQNDRWIGGLGRFLPGTLIEYVVGVEDGSEAVHYDNDGGLNYSVMISTGAPLAYLGGAYHWPTNGALSSSDSLWLNLFASPSESLVHAYAEYSVNGWVWEVVPLSYWQMDGSNEWWHVELGSMPPASTVWYSFVAQDGEATTYIRPSSGLPYSAVVAGSAVDSDLNGLPDDWEIYWFGGIGNTTAHANPDQDGLPDMPIDNWMEHVMGTDPTVSNVLDEISVLWKPSIPLQGGALKLSVRSSSFDGLNLSAIDVHFADGTWATLAAASGDRFEGVLLLSETSTVCTITSLEGGGETDTNRGLGWTIPIRLLGPGEVADSDGDGMPDAWEVAYGLDPFVNDADGDADGDGLSNLQEYQLGTNPRNPDTSGDGMSDGTAHLFGFDPTVSNTAVQVWFEVPRDGWRFP